MRFKLENIMTNLRFFKVIAECYEESKEVYVISDGRYDMTQEKGYKASETGGFKKIVTGQYIKSLKLEEFELIGENPNLSSKEYYYKLEIGKSLGKYKIPIPINEDGKFYVDSFDILPNNIILYPTGEAKGLLSWYTIHNSISVKHYKWNTRVKSGISENVCNENSLQKEFSELVDFTRF